MQFSIILKSIFFPGSSDDEESSCNAGDLAPSLGWEDPLEKGMSTHSSILARRIPWTEVPGTLQSMKSIMDSNRCFLSVMENRGENPERILSRCHHSPTTYMKPWRMVLHPIPRWRKRGFPHTPPAGCPIK